MVRCKGITVSGKRCKKSCEALLCNIHENKNKNCELCNKNQNHKITLKRCNHTFCKDCLLSDVYDYQWFDGFSTDNPLMCPHCDTLFCDSDWKYTMDKLVDNNLLQREIVHTNYLDKKLVNSVYEIITFGKEYTLLECYRFEDTVRTTNQYLNISLTDEEIYNLFHRFDSIPSVVYFYKQPVQPENLILKFYPRYTYVFQIDYPLLKVRNELLFKELVEYMFKPERVQRLGLWEYLESI